MVPSETITFLSLLTGESTAALRQECTGLVPAELAALEETRQRALQQVQEVRRHARQRRAAYRDAAAATAPADEVDTDLLVEPPAGEVSDSPHV